VVIVRIIQEPFVIRSIKHTFLAALVWRLTLVIGFFACAGAMGQETEAQPEAETVRAAYLDPENKKQMALANTLQEHEKVWLDVQYPESEIPVKVLAIAHSSLIADKQGAILLLHDKEQHADWPQIIGPLRKSLPKYGWFTLAVNLPDELRVQLPQRELAPKTLDQIDLTDALKKNLDSGGRVRIDPEAEAENAAANPEDVPENLQSAEQDQPQDGAPEQEEGVDINLAAATKEASPKIPYEERAIRHIEKAMTYLKNQNLQNIVLLAHRHSSELAFQYIKMHQAELTTPGFALILIEPVLPESYLLDVTQWFGTSFKPPILDIVNTSDALAESLAEQRKFAFERASVKAYRQIFLAVSNSEQFHDTLSRRVRHWLENAAPGMSVTR
jgi:hypothetical protein